MIKQEAKTTQGMAGGGELPTACGPRPWEDRSASASDRFESYKAVVISKIEGILESSKREGISNQERKALMEDPETQFWAHEQQLLLKETPEQFCGRIDRELIPKLLGKNFLGAEAWERGFGVNVGEVPQLPKSITSELLEGECPLHPGEKIKDTHILMLVPKTVNGEPYSAVKLGELCSSRKGSGDKLIYDRVNVWKSESWAQESPAASEWVLIPKADPDPEKMREKYPADGDERHFRGKRISRPKGELEPDCKKYQSDVHAKHYEAHYREAKAIEEMTKVMLTFVATGEHLSGKFYLRCQEPNASGGRVLVGLFLAGGLKVRVDVDVSDSVNVGRSLAWKSKS